VHVIARTLGQPLLYFRMLMGSVIIQHEMDLQAGVDRLINPTGSVKTLV